MDVTGAEARSRQRFGGNSFNQTCGQRKSENDMLNEGCHHRLEYSSNFNTDVASAQARPTCSMKDVANA
eukprot:6784515-Pyramimonas_sp.AAC.1